MPLFRLAHVWVLCCLLVSLNPSVLAQGARVNPSGAGEEADQDHPAEREQWFMQGRVAPKGKTPAEMRWQAYQQKIQLRAARIVAARQAKAAATGGSATNAAASTGWTALGPAPLVSDPGTGQDYGFVSGRATSVVIDPADSTGNTVYLGGAYGGLWRTQNGLSGGFGNPSGVTWTPMIDTMGTLAVGAIAIQPGNATGSLSNTILVGTGEANSSADSYYGLGILRSTDHGQNWSLISQDSLGNPFHGLAFSKIAFSTTSCTTNLCTVVAATATSTLGLLDGSRTGAEKRGVYVSLNAGQTWAYETSVKDGSTAISPASSSVTSVSYNAAAGLFYAAFRYHGIYSSTDGAIWTRLSVQPAAAGTGLNNSATCPTVIPNPNSPTCPFYRGEITVVPTRNEMYIWYTDQSDADQGIWKSIDGGGRWTPINFSDITNCGMQDADGGCGTLQGGYDLELAAVANGVDTDIYAGARNIYKCTITASSPTCSSTTEPNFFMNLTHVYGCHGISKVHPDQHGLDAMVAGGKAVMYFANDGGVYRAVDGFAGLHTGVCGNTNQFDSLNGTLGSMTEFVSMSQDATDSAIVLGGTQDNGSPSTSQTNTNWHNVLGGDGGYNEINPNTTGTSGQWFNSNPPFKQNNVFFNINIYSCSLGSGCLDGNFSNTTQNSTIGGDKAPFYPFFMLDPQIPSKMIIGTACRLWRGDVSTGVASGFVALTDSFETAGAVPCTGKEVNQVHAVGAGGVTDTNGSKVMYAVTEGTGPNLAGPGGVPTGGEVWATINASGATSTWANVTSTINPGHFSIGAVVLDPSDTTGFTAYVGIQGFHASHVFMTTNHGGSWTDFSGTLPDAPVNSLVIDPAAAVIYAGTDVGVFSSPTSSIIWTEVGPAPAPGVTGYLPDAPVTKLRLFSNGGTKLLRASTYGRGIWEFALATVPPDFTVSVPTTTLTTYPNQTVGFNGTLTAINRYASPVDLSCTGAKPGACSAIVTPVTPTSLGAAFTIDAAHGTTGDFNFTIHAAGTDAVPQVHDTGATLHVVNFAIGAPNPATVTANVPNTSNATTFQVTAQGSFADAVTLSCSGLPVGATCNFSPSATVQPALASPVLVTLTIGTTASTPGGATSTITITAHDATNPEPAPKTQSLTLKTTATPDYALAISNTAITTTVLGNPAAVFNGTLTAVNGYAGGTITLTCGSGAPATCTPPAPITLAASGTASFTIPASSATLGTFNFNIHGTDGTITHNAPVTLTVNADFHVPTTVVTCTPVTVGGASTCSIPIGPDPLTTFANNVTYTCATVGFPNLSSCSFNPASIPAGTAATTVTLTIHTTAAVASLRTPGPSRPSGPLFAFWLSLPALGIVSMGAHLRSRNRLAAIGGALLVLALLGSFLGCGGGNSGGGGQPGTNKGTYTFNVDATSNGIKHSAPMSVTVN